MSFQVQPAPRIDEGADEKQHDHAAAIGAMSPRHRRQAPPTTSTASATATIRSDGRNGRAADRAATRAAHAYRPSCRSHRQRGPPRRSSGRGHRVRTLPFSVSKVLPPFFAVVRLGQRRRRAQDFAQARAGGPARCCLCAIPQTFFCMFSVFLWPFLSWSPICGGIPHFGGVGIDVFDHLEFGLAEIADQLAGLVRRRLRSLAALISLPRFSASSRSGTNPFMQASAGAARLRRTARCDIPPAGAAPRSETHRPPETARRAAEPAAAASAVHGGNGEAFACRSLARQRRRKRALRKDLAGVEVTTATVSGTIKRRIIKAVPPARSRRVPRRPNEAICDRTFYDSCRGLTTR